MRMLGAHLRAIGSMTDTMFADSMRWGLVGRLHMRAQTLSSDAAHASAALPEWHADVRGRRLLRVVVRMAGHSGAISQVRIEELPTVSVHE
jgi:hypothetical protein